MQTMLQMTQAHELSAVTPSVEQVAKRGRWMIRVPPRYGFASGKYIAPPAVQLPIAHAPVSSAVLSADAQLMIPIMAAPPSLSTHHSAAPPTVSSALTHSPLDPLHLPASLGRLDSMTHL